MMAAKTWARRRFCAWTLALLLLAPAAQAQYGHPGEPLYDTMDAAFKALKVKDYDRAIEELKKATTLAPQRADIQKQLGYAYIKTGQTEPAIGAFERVHALDAGDLSSALQLAFLYDSVRQDEKAADLFREVAAGSSASLAKMANTSLANLGEKYKGEIAQVQSALLTDPSSVEYHRRLGALLFRANRLREAVPHLEYVAKHQGDADNAYDLGRALLALGDRTQATWYLEKASHAGNPEIAANAAGLAGKVNDLDLLRALTAQYPADNRFRRELGFLLIQKNDAAGARQQFEAAVSNNPADTLSRMQLGYLLEKEGAGAQAREQFGLVAAADDPKYGKTALDAFHKLGGTTLPPPPAIPAEAADELRAEGIRLANHGKVADAILVYKKLHAMTPQDYAVTLRIAYWYWVTDVAEAKVWFQQAAQAPDPQIAEEARRALSMIEGKPSPKAEDLRKRGEELNKAGKTAEAIQAYKQAYELDPGDGSAALKLGYLYWGSNLSAARTWFGRAAESSTPAVSEEGKRAAGMIDRELATYSLKESGYELQRKGDTRGAIRNFEQAVALSPDDYTAMRQIAWWYYALHDYPRSQEWFNRASGSPDPSQAEQAQTALRSVAREARPWFLNMYGVPLVTARYSDLISYGQIKLGYKAGTPLHIEPYLSLRVAQDTRTRGGSLPRIFTDNSAVFAVGMALHPLIPNLSFIGEAGNAVSMLQEPPPDRGRAVPDYRGGIVYYGYWGAPLDSTDRRTPPRFTIPAGFREIYFDTEFYSRYGNDVIGYLQYKEGFRLPALGDLRTQVFWNLNLAKDSNSDYYNNALEFGPGLRFGFKGIPFPQIGVQLLRGVYLTQGHHIHNTGKPNYWDARVYLVLAHYF